MASFTIADAKDPDAVLLGLGRLGLAPHPAVSPLVFTDVGYIKACSITYSREVKDFESAGIVVKRLVFRDRLNLESQWAEVSIDNLGSIIPSTSSMSGAKISFGGDRTITRYQVRFEHQRSDGKIIQIDLFKSTPSGDVALAFAEEEYIQYPVNFLAEADTTKTAGQQYGSVQLVT